MKKVYMLGLSILLLLMLVACGGRMTDDSEISDDEGSFKNERQETSLFGGKTLIAGALKKSDYEIKPSTKSVPDLGLFLGRRGEEAIEYGDSGEQKVQLESEEDLQLVLEYIELLQSEDFGFEIVGSSNYDPESDNPFGEAFYGGHWEVAFASTKINGGREKTSVFSNTPCDVYIYESKKNWYVTYSSVFEIVDCGHRYAGYEGDRIGDIEGKRATDAYYQKGSKYYNESDEKLTVDGKKREDYEWVVDYKAYIARKGQSAVIVDDGEPQTGTARIEKNWKKSSKSKSAIDCYVITVEDFLPQKTDEALSVVLPLEIQEGDVFRLTDFLSNHQKDAEKTCFEFVYTPDFTYSGIRASYNMKVSGSIEACTIRVLQWDATGKKECVLYISGACWVDAEPVTVEAIIAAPVNEKDKLKTKAEKEAEKSSGGSSGFSIFNNNNDTNDGPYIPDHSKLDCLTCGGDGDCNSCGGYGETYSYMGAGESIKTKCKTCYGSGNCRTCNGSGKRD